MEKESPGRHVTAPFGKFYFLRYMVQRGICCEIYIRFEMMKKVLLAILAGIMVLFNSACNETDFIKATVYNQNMEKIDEFDIAYEAVSNHSDDNEESEILRSQLKEKFGYEYMSEFKNGFSFVRKQSDELLSRGNWDEDNSLSVTWYQHRVEFLGSTYSVSAFLPDSEEEVQRYKTGYKLIDREGNIIFDNLDAADFSIWYIPGTMTEPGRQYDCITILPSYFTDYGIAVVKYNGNFGLINTSGDILLDFNYEEITIVDKNTLTLKIK